MELRNISPVRELIISENDKKRWDECMLLHREILKLAGHDTLAFFYDYQDFTCLADMRDQLEELLEVVRDMYYEIDDGEEDGQRHDGRLPGVVGRE